jgi:hypothetical protein
MKTSASFISVRIAFDALWPDILLATSSDMHWTNLRATATAALASAEGISNNSVALNSDDASTRHTAPPSVREVHASSSPPSDSSAESPSSASDAAVPLPTRGRYRAASLVARFVPLDDDRLLAVNSWALAVATLYLMLVLMLSASLPSILALPLPALTAWLLFKQQPQVAESILVLARLPFFASRFYLEERDI